MRFALLLALLLVTLAACDQPEEDENYEFEESNRPAYDIVLSTDNMITSTTTLEFSGGVPAYFDDAASDIGMQFGEEGDRDNAPSVGFTIDTGTLSDGTSYDIAQAVIRLPVEVEGEEGRMTCDTLESGTVTITTVEDDQYAFGEFNLVTGDCTASAITSAEDIPAPQEMVEATGTFSRMPFRGE